MPTLDSTLADAIGGRTAKALEKAFGMQTVGDLLNHYPRRMAERGELTELSSLRVDDDVTVVADVRTTAVKGPPANPRLEVIVGDGPDQLHLVFFGRRSTWRKNELQPGARGLFSGKVGVFNGKRQLVHPEYMLLRGESLDETAADVYAGRLIPIYPATQSVRTWVISNAVKQTLLMLDHVPDPHRHRDPGPSRPAGTGRRPAGDARAGRLRAVGRGPAPARLGRGDGGAAGARPAAVAVRRESGGAAPAPRRRAARRVRRAACRSP